MDLTIGLSAGQAVAGGVRSLDLIPLKKSDGSSSVPSVMRGPWPASIRSGMDQAGGAKGSDLTKYLRPCGLTCFGPLEMGLWVDFWA